MIASRDGLISEVALHALSIIVVPLARTTQDVVVSHNTLVDIQVAASVCAELVAVVAGKTSARVGVIGLAERRNCHTDEGRVEVVALYT